MRSEPLRTAAVRRVTRFLHQQRVRKHYKMPYREAKLLVHDDATAIRAISSMLVKFPNQRFASICEVGLLLGPELTPDLILRDAGMLSISA